MPLVFDGIWPDRDEQRRVRAAIAALVPPDATYVIALATGHEAVLTQDNHAIKDGPTRAPLRSMRAIEMRHVPRYLIWDRRDPDLRQTAPDLAILIAAVALMPELGRMARTLLGKESPGWER